MHRLLPIVPAPRSWSPKLSPFWVRAWRPVRRLTLKHVENVHKLEVYGLEHFQSALCSGSGVMIAPNHAAFPDAYLLMDPADQLGTTLYIMSAWQVFGTRSWFHQWVLQKHGCFSIDREGTDIAAFKTAVRILAEQPHPLVVFPEGDIYRRSEKVTPFRDGAAAIALSAAKRSDRPIVIVPCGLRYYHLADPSKALSNAMDLLETTLHWTPRRNDPLFSRIHRFAEGLLSVKEIEFFGAGRSGPLPERIRHLAEVVIQPTEARHNLAKSGTILDRIKTVRQRVLQLMPDADETTRKSLAADLGAAHMASQLFSYPGDYLAEKPTVERAAETIAKFEEDVLGKVLARPKGPQAAVVHFGPPMVVPKSADRSAATLLTQAMESAVQVLLDTSPIPDRPWSRLS